MWLGNLAPKYVLFMGHQKEIFRTEWLDWGVGKGRPGRQVEESELYLEVDSDIAQCLSLSL